MASESLAEFYADFERWLPGVFDGSPLNVHFGVPYLPDSESDWAVSALIESAVLDELERRDWEVFNIRKDSFGICTNTAKDEEDVDLFWGQGPTRLARLHAACKAAFGKESQ